MKVGCCIKTAEIDQAILAGFDCVELSGVELAELSETAIQGLAEKLEKIPCVSINFYCSSHIQAVGPQRDLQAAEKYAESLFAKAKSLGISMVGLGIPSSRRAPEGYSLEKAHQEFEEFVKVTACIGEKYGIIVLAENVNHLLCNVLNSLEETGELAARIGGPNVGVLLDDCNMLTENEPVTAARNMSGLLRHVHVGHQLEDGKRNPLTEIDLPRLRELCRVLHEIDYQGTISMEAPLPAEAAVAKACCDIIRLAWRLEESK